MPQKPPAPPPVQPARAPAPHVRTAIRAAQAKLPDRSVPRNPPQSPAPPKLQSRPQAEHVRRALAPVQAKLDSIRRESAQVIQPRSFSAQGRSLKTTDFEIKAADGKSEDLNDILGGMQKGADAAGMSSLTRALVNDLDDYMRGNEPSTKWVARETVAGVFGLLERIGAAKEALQAPPQPPAAGVAAKTAAAGGNAGGNEKGALRGHLEALRSRIGLLKASKEYDALKESAAEINKMFGEAGAFNAAAVKKSLEELGARVSPQGAGRAAAAPLMTQAAALEWAKKQDFSPAENSKQVGDGTLCNVEVCLQGAAKSIGDQKNTAMGEKPHAEKKWWNAHSEKLLKMVSAGGTVVLFHISRIPCAGGCDVWMKGAVYSAIQGAAGGRQVFVLVKTYQDDDGGKHLYAVTPGALTDTKTW